MPSDDGFIPKHGGFRDLLSYQKAEIVYDGTLCFCRRFLSRGDRTIDQMVQGARSGKQNIAEGSRASAHSKETEIRLTSVARASLDELLLDYEDFLRNRDLVQWEPDTPAAKKVRRLSATANASYGTFREYLESRSAGTVANIIICLIHQTNFLLDRQIDRLERDFLANGGLRERMTKARLKHRSKAKQPSPPTRPSKTD